MSNPKLQCPRCPRKLNKPQNLAAHIGKHARDDAKAAVMRDTIERARRREELFPELVEMLDVALAEVRLRDGSAYTYRSGKGLLAKARAALP